MMRLLPLLSIVMLIAVANAAIIHVPDDYAEVQTAIDSSATGDTILVAEGVYEGGVVIRGHGLTLAGEYILDQDSSHIALTVLQAAPPPAPGERVITVDSTITDTVRIIGLSITGGRLEDLNGGGGIFSMHGNIVIDHNIVYDNSAYSGGGIKAQNSIALITNNYVYDNHGVLNSGGISADSGVVEITGNLVCGNQSDLIGGGFCSVYCFDGLMSHNIFRQNDAHSLGGGVAILWGTWEITENRFEDNTGGWGAGLGLLDNYSVVLTSNTINGNHAIADFDRMGSAGGLFVGGWSNDMTIQYNIFIENISDNDGGGAILSASITFDHNAFIRNRAVFSSAVCAFPENGIIVTVQGHHNLFYDNDPTITYPDGTVYEAACTSTEGCTLDLHENDFYRNDIQAVGIAYPFEGPVIALNNYWGDPSGPYQAEQNPFGLGDTVESDIDIIPFSQMPFSPWHPPSAPQLIAPLEDEVVAGPEIVLSWFPAGDIDDGDTLRHFLEISATADFDDPAVYQTDYPDMYVLDDFGNTDELYWRVYAMDQLDLRSRYSDTRHFFIAVSVTRDSRALPERFAIESVHPNPFNERVTLQVGNPREQRVTIEVCDVLGRGVATLWNGVLQPGGFTFSWRPQCAAGVYFVSLRGENSGTDLAKLMYIK